MGKPDSPAGQHRTPACQAGKIPAPLALTVCFRSARL